MCHSVQRACGPSGLLGEASRKRRRLPQPRLLRVSVPVTLLVPSAYRHSACAVQPLNFLHAVPPNTGRIRLQRHRTLQSTETLTCPQYVRVVR